MTGGFLFPVLFWLLTSRFLTNRLGPGFGTGEIKLLSALFLGVTIVVSVELLNAFHFLTVIGAIVFWGAACLAVMLLIALSQKDGFFASGRRLDEILRDFQDGDRESRLLFAGIFGIITLQGVIAVFAIPNNWDSMCYHLSRVAFWREYESISFFATNNPRQNSLSPFAEWTVLLLSLLQGHIAFANMVQWLSFAGCVLGVSEISRLLGAGRHECLIAAFFCATLPIAILESTGTQNDLVVSFWLTLVVYGSIKLTLTPSWFNTLVFGAAVGLALLTKTTMVIFAAPFFLWVLWVLIPHGWTNVAGKFALISALIIGLNAGHFLRNLETSGSPFGPNGNPGPAYTNETHTPAAIFSNIVRNLALHTQFTQEEWPTTTRFVIKLHQWLAIDPYDPKTSWNVPRGTPFVHVTMDGYSPMPFHLAVILLSFGFICFSSTRYSFSYRALVWIVIICALLFCYVLKWQVWNVRLQMPLFVISSPFCAAVLNRQWPEIRRWSILAVIFLSAVPHLCDNPYRPAFGSDNVFTAKADEQRFRVRPPFAMPYQECQRILRQAGVRSVGVIASASDEFSLFDPQFNGYPPPYTIDHIMVHGLYAKFEKKILPDSIVCLEVGPTLSIRFQGKEYRSVYQVYDVSEELMGLGVFLPKVDAGKSSTPSDQTVFIPEQ